MVGSINGYGGIGQGLILLPERPTSSHEPHKHSRRSSPRLLPPPVWWTAERHDARSQEAQLPHTRRTPPGPRMPYLSGITREAGRAAHSHPRADP